MSNRKWGFFPFDTLDYKAAQAYLDKKARDGWVLDHIYLRRFARFIPAEGRYHCVDVGTAPAFEDEQDWDYVEFCEDAGWELVKAKNGMLIFRSKPGQHPAPIQTDEGMEADRFWKRYLRRNLIWLLILLFVILPLYVFAFFRSPGTIPFSEYLCNNTILLVPPFLLLGVICILRDLICIIRAARHVRRTGTVPVPKSRSAWVFGLLSFLAVLLLIFGYCVHFVEIFNINKTVDVEWSFGSQVYTATPELCQSYPVITAADLGLPYSEDSRYLDGQRSLLVDFLDYSEITDGEKGSSHILTTERYECISETLASWLFASRRVETSHRHGFLWGELEWGEVTSDHGFDCICFARDDSYLLALEGDTVILVGASEMDLIDHLDTIRQRLELED